jgi:hypothetical protein
MSRFGKELFVTQPTEHPAEKIPPENTTMTPQPALPANKTPRFPDLGPTGTESLASLLDAFGKSIDDVDTTPPISEA